MAVGIMMSTAILPIKAQTTIDTLRWWNLNEYSETTLTNLATDTKNWKPMSKNGVLQRYANNVTTDGKTLKANGTIIKELDGLLVGAGISAGSLLLRHNMGETQNGMQMQNVAPITINNLKAGNTLVVNIKSSSKNSAGIASVTNLNGDCGEGTYPTTSFKRYEFKVVADGSVSFKNSGGVVVKSIGVININEDTRQQVAAPKINVDGNIITITSGTPDAKIFYSLVDHGTVMDYAQTYESAFLLNRPCNIKAIAVRDDMKDSETSKVFADVPYEFAYAGKPFTLAPEQLTRGFIATETSTGMLISWRRFGDDRAISFKVYRNGNNLVYSGNGLEKTNILDKAGKPTDIYTLEVAEGNVTIETATAIMLKGGKLEIPLNRPASGTTESGNFEYIPGDCMVADVDGDKEYEIVMKWDPSNRKDNSESGYTGNTLIDCYRISGEHLWRIDLGKNIRSGAHYTQPIVYDLDGDGRAEVACKTAPGTIDGKGKYVIMNNDDPNADYRGTAGGKSGMVISGPEYLTVFNGLTGEQLATVAYNPPRNITDAWGDAYGNRSERYLACLAYLDGKHPSMVFCRGYYTAAYLWAVDFNGTSLTTRWLHASTTPDFGAYGEGAHAISVADVDGDLCDEIIYGACAIDNDGQLMYRTGLGHGDAMHVGDFMPDRKGLEVMMVHEDLGAIYGVEMHDAMTGEILSGYKTGSDVGRGLCADVDADARGCEYWSTADNGVYDIYGNQISTKRPTVNFRTYWDGDVQEEFCETGEIKKWNGRSSSAKSLVNFSSKYGAGTNVIKYTPCLQADIFGDWREEVIYYDEATKSKLWIFSTPYECHFSVPTLMHDHHYRMATVWQMAAYNQPPHLSYYLPDYVDQLASGIHEIPTDKSTSNHQVRYYNLQGIEVEVPQNGIYIIDDNNEKRKINFRAQ